MPRDVRILIAAIALIVLMTASLALFGVLMAQTAELRALSITQCEFLLAHTVMGWLPAVTIIAILGGAVALAVLLSRGRAMTAAMTGLLVLGTLATMPSGITHAQSSSDCLRFGDINHFSVTIPEGELSASANHGFSSAPSSVLVTARDEQGAVFWTTVGATQVTVTLPATQSGDVSYDGFAVR